MEHYTIRFIGGGNMARSMIGGLIAGGADPSRLQAADPDANQRAELARLFGIHTVANNLEQIADVNILVLAVKPQMLGRVVRELAPAVREHQPLLISIAAGVRLTTIERWVGVPAAIVRAMPNTPAMVGSGATALFANARVSSEQRNRAESIMRAVGLALWIEDEAQMDTVTALSGSGPAYFFLFMEALEQAATARGLPATDARLLAMETALGAARMALSSNEDVATLRARVTSPGGTTERALGVFEGGGLRDLVARAVNAAGDRASEMADELDRG